MRLNHLGATYDLNFIGPSSSFLSRNLAAGKPSSLTTRPIITPDRETLSRRATPTNRTAALSLQ